MAIAVIGLFVNLVSAFLLKGHEHGHHHHHADHTDAHADLNLRSAYLHVLADAATSVLAIFALAGGKFMHWNWLDPVMGIVGAIMVSAWSYSLLRDTSQVLLDREMDCEVVHGIREAIESDNDTRISDLHVWRVGKNKFGCIVSIVASDPNPPEHYKRLLKIYEELVHITIEVTPCMHHSDVVA